MVDVYEEDGVSFTIADGGRKVRQHPESLKSLKGAVRIQAWEKCPNFPDDRSKDVEVYDRLFDNLVVCVGKDSILKQIGGTGLSCGGTADMIGVGDSTSCPSGSQTNLQAATNKTWKQISTCDKTYVRPTLFLSADFGFAEANYTWNEVAIADDQGGTPPTIGTALMWARQVDCTPLVKTSAKRAIVEWQFSL